MNLSSQHGNGGGAPGESRYRWLYLVVGIAFAVLLGRLWYLQILKGDTYHRVSTQNIVRNVEEAPPRGRIFDRHGVKLAGNRTAYDVVIIPHILKQHDVDEVVARLRRHLNLTDERVEKLRATIAEDVGDVTVRSDITRSQVAALETDRMYLPGVEVQAHAKRVYPLDEIVAHLVGFMGEVNQKELRTLRDVGYGPGDYIGRMGLEEAYEGVLRGAPGIDRQVVNARGIAQGSEESKMMLGQLHEVEPMPGRDMILNVDARLQLAAHRAMAGYPSGAAVALDPANGSILAMYSKPTFNPNSWSGQLASHEKMEADNDPFKPMLDKTVNAYFPGSVFKVVGAWAALDRGTFTPDEEVDCPGYYRFGGRRFRCWKWGGHGEVDLTDALQHSCDVYFYKLAEKMGIDPLSDHAFRFGFGQRTGVSINHESKGRVPTREWHRKHSPNGYQPGFALNTVLGQGDTLSTPLQVALAYGAIANGGTLWYPRIVNRIQTGEGRILYDFKPKVRKKLTIEDPHLDLIRRGLWKAVNREEGTASDARLDEVDVAGKTGTAQVHSIGEVRIQNRNKVFRLRDHAWFAAYAPADDPEIVVAVFLEHAGHGGEEAGPVAKHMLETYFNPSNEAALARKIDGLTLDEEAP
jgi:penicillin-binding protein 2